VSSGKINPHTMQYFLSTETDDLDQGKGSKVKVKYSKLFFFDASIGSFKLNVFKLDWFEINTSRARDAHTYFILSTMVTLWAVDKNRRQSSSFKFKIPM
jgi:hypothetical protein